MKNVQHELIDIQHLPAKAKSTELNYWVSDYAVFNYIFSPLMYFGQYTLQQELNSAAASNLN